MELPEGYEVIESVAVEMDPALDGFAGVLFELVFDGERYVLAETALGSGNRLLHFRCRDRRLVYSLFESELSEAGGARFRPRRRTASGRAPHIGGFES